MRTFRRIAVCFVAAWLLTPSRAGAQNEPLKRSEAIPLDLATALATSGGFTTGGDPQILVGAIPEWIQSKLHIPAGSRVLGSAFLGSTVVGVINIPTWSDTLVKELERGFLRLGWKQLPRSLYEQGGGFRLAPVANPPVMTSFSLCMDNQMITVRTNRQSASTNVVLRASGSSSGPNPCAPRQYPGQADRPPMPTLYDPAGATNRSATECIDSMESMGSGVSYNGTGTRLRTTMTPDAVLDHYARQLQDSGWTVSPGIGMSIERTWARRDSTGRNSEITLTVKASPKNAACMDISLRILSEPRNR